MLDARKLQHQAPLTWQSRYAPRCVGDELPPITWRERAQQHRDSCPVLQGQRPPKPIEVKYVPQVLQSQPEETVEFAQEESLVLSPVPPQKLDDDDADGDCFGVLSRVELSRYIARKSAKLVRNEIDEVTRLHNSQSVSEEDLGGAKKTATDLASLQDVPLDALGSIPWMILLDALAFEKEQLRRGFSNQWPDALWSPACMDREAASEFERKLTNKIRDIEKAADAQDSIRTSLETVPIAILLRQLLCDARIAVGNLSGAAEALFGAVIPEAGADPLQPPLLLVWGDSLNCNYLKAQQCLRLGRLAVMAAAESLAAAQAGVIRGLESPGTEHASLTALPIDL